MKIYKDYVMETCGGWGWEAAAEAACAEAVYITRCSLEHSYLPMLLLGDHHRINLAWVDCLVFFLMGLKEGK